MKRINCFAVCGAYDDFGLHLTGPLSYHENEASARIELARKKAAGGRTIADTDPSFEIVEDEAGAGRDTVCYVCSLVIDILDLTKENP